MTDAGSAAECTASGLFLLLWNRRTPAGFDVVGNKRILDAWWTRYGFDGDDEYRR